jgi:predicted sulfurtransferase
MRFLNFLVLAAVAVVAFVACNSADNASKLPSVSPDIANKTKPAAPPHTDAARRINVTEAQSLIAKNQAVVVDVRNQAAFDQGHIRGAKLIPFGEVANRVNELPRDKTIITYCS